MHGVHGTTVQKSSNRETAKQSDIGANVRETNRAQPAKRELRVLPAIVSLVSDLSEVTAPKCYCISSAPEPGTETDLVRHGLVMRLRTSA
jgi:hypothetical protein